MKGERDGAKLGMEDWVQWVIAAVCLAVTIILQAEVALLFIGAGILGIMYYGNLFRRPPPLALQVTALPVLAPARAGPRLPFPNLPRQLRSCLREWSMHVVHDFATACYGWLSPRVSSTS
jgi:hypothetical protein